MQYLSHIYLMLHWLGHKIHHQLKDQINVSLMEMFTRGLFIRSVDLDQKSNTHSTVE